MRKPVRFERRHFAAFAEVLQELTAFSHTATGQETADEAVRLFQQLGKRTNPQFDAARFLAAATPGANAHARVHQ